MSLLATLNLTADGTVSVKCKNHDLGLPHTYTAIATGSFGGGTLTAQLSPNGLTFVDLQEGGVPVTFTAGFAKNFNVNSTENEPVFLGFDLTGSAAPSIEIKIYDIR